MAEYTLTYFAVEAKGELIRLIFAQAGVKYNNVRLSFDEWPPLKPSTPFGHLPVLEIKDCKEKLNGSGVISRYLAEKFGLAGEKEFQNAVIAGIKDYQDEIVVSMVRAFFEKDQTVKEEKIKDLCEKAIPNHLGLLENAVKRNPSGETWLYGSSVTYVDLNLYLVVNAMKQYIENEVLNYYPAVKKIYEAVGSLPNIAEYLKNRPERTFGPPVA